MEGYGGITNVKRVSYDRGIVLNISMQEITLFLCVSGGGGGGGGGMYFKAVRVAHA